MNKSNTQALICDFPYLYREARAGAQSCMQFGFSVGDGWFKIVYKLSAAIEERARAMGIDQQSEQWPSAREIKEKFGALRYSLSGHYVSSVRNYFNLIEVAKAEAAVTCECCGLPGVIRDKNWIKVSCDRCDDMSNEIHARNFANYRAQELAGGYRAVINEAFAQVDAKGIFSGAVVVDWKDEEQ